MSGERFVIEADDSEYWACLDRVAARCAALSLSEQLALCAVLDAARERALHTLFEVHWSEAEGRMRVIPGPALLDLALPPETVAAWLSSLAARRETRPEAPSPEMFAETKGWRLLRRLLRRRIGGGRA